MATLLIDSRFHPNANELSIYKLKKNVKNNFIEKFGNDYEITQQVITHGKPTQNMPALKEGEFVIRTSAHIPEEDVEMMRLKIAGKSNG